MLDTDMVPVATVGSSFEARLLAARLGAAGIVWEFRGAVEGPYPLGPIDVLVPGREADDARRLLDQAVEFGESADDGRAPRRPVRSGRRRILLAAIGLACAGFAALRSLVLG